MLHFISHPDYDIPLPAGHRFPAHKFTSLMDRILSAGIAQGGRLSHPRPASPEALAIAHAPQYIDAIAYNRLSPDDLRRLGLPWSEALAKRSFLAVEGTYRTALKALQFGLACHGAGGTHHAHHDYGAGFCVFNDMAYAAMRLIQEGQAGRVLILDGDVHQGDGTATILSGRAEIYTCSLHCEANYPYEKARSDRDVILPDGMTDDAYLKVMAVLLEELAAEVRPDLVIYDAGIDVHQDDVLGRLAMTGEGIRKREAMVLSFFMRQGVPVATVIGGGYTKEFDQMIALHGLVFQEAARLMRRHD